MKRIINGITYNTDTATRVTGEDDPAWTGTWWDLYQTRHGAFFRIMGRWSGPSAVTVPYRGEPDEITPLTDQEAQAIVEKYANHLVEKYFGRMPEYGAAERRLTIRIPGNLAERMDDAAKSKGLSLNSYAMRCFEQCAAQDGQPRFPSQPK